MVVYRRLDERDLNAQARAVRRVVGQVGGDYRLQAECGGRDFAAGDRMYFLRKGLRQIRASG
jgi:hypothetical protein